MEKITDRIKLAGLQQERIRKSFDEAQAQAHSILLLTLQWKDLESHFDLAKDSLLKQAQDLDLQAKKISETTQALERRDQEVEIKLKEVTERSDELQMNEKHLGLVKQWIEECTLELNSKEKELNLARKEVEGCNGMLSIKRRELELVQNEHKECSKVLSSKKKQLGTIDRLIDECTRKLKSEEMKLSSVKVKLEECCKELSVKNGQLKSVQKSLQACTGELEVRKKEVERMKILATNCDEELQLKQKELATLKNLTTDCDAELQLKHEELKMLQELTNEHSRKFDLEARKLSEMKKSIDQCQNELDLKKKEFDATQKNMQECLKELDLKEKELTKVQKLIEENSQNLYSKEKHLDSIKQLIGENTEELEAKEKQYDSIKNSISKSSVELTMKQSELELIDKCISEHSSELQSTEEKLVFFMNISKQLADQLESKEEDFNTLKETMKTYCKDLELKERKFNAIQESIRKRNDELALKEELLKSVQMSIIKSSQELEAMKKQEISVEKSIREWSEELESKKKNLDLVRKSLKDCCNGLTSKGAELDSMQRMNCGCGLHKENEEREKYFDSLKRTLLERSEKLEMKERQFEVCAKELELREQQIDLMQKLVDERSKQVEVKEKQLNESFHSQVTIPRPENLMANSTINLLSAGYQCCITDNGSYLLLVLNNNLIKHDLVDNEVFTAIQKSPDPSKLVLDAIQGFYPTGTKKGDIEVDLGVIRRSCTTLLGHLLKISPQIKPGVREEAMKLARDWKSRMKAVPEDSLEVLGFLQLLAAFKLASSFSRDEIQTLLDSVYQHSQALELQKVLGIAERLPMSNNSAPPVAIEQVDHLRACSPEHFSTTNFQSVATIDEMTSPLILNDYMGDHDLKPDEVVAALKSSPDPAKFVLGVLQGSYFQHRKNGGAGLDASVIKSKILLMEQLVKVSPTLSPMVKEEAIKLALSWKANVKLDAEKSIEVWAFLLFLAIYRLMSYFGGEEIIKLVLVVADRRRAPDICRILGLTAKIPEIVQILLGMKQYIAAARFSCAFGLVNNFPLENILQLCLKHIRGGPQDKAITKELSALRAILQCISDYKLETRYATQNIINRIIELEKQNASSRTSSGSKDPVLIVQPPPKHNLNNLTIDFSSSSKDQPSPPFIRQQLHNQNPRNGFQLQGSNKRPRIDVSVDRSCSSQLVPR